MRLPYRFNEIGDPQDNAWGRDAASMTWEFVHYKREPYSAFSTHRNIEEQIEILSKAIGGLAEVLISKGRMSPQEFLKALDAEDSFEVRNNSR